MSIEVLSSLAQLKVMTIRNTRISQLRLMTSSRSRSGILSRIILLRSCFSCCRVLLLNTLKQKITRFSTLYVVMMVLGSSAFILVSVERATQACYVPFPV